MLTMLCIFRKQSFIKVAQIILLVIAISANASAQSIAEPSNERFAVGEDLIVSIKLDTLPIGETFALKSEQNMRLNFDEFITLVDFPITKVDKFRYVGWFISQEKQFSMMFDGKMLVVESDGERFEVGPEHYSYDFGGLYIELEQIDEWFKLNADIDYEDLTVVLQPKNPFPLQLANQRKRRNVAGTRSGNGVAVQPFLNRGYELFSAQVFDLQASIISNDANTTSNYSVFAAREIAFNQVNFFATGTDDFPITLARLNVSKRSANKNLLGPLHATQYEFGDVTPTRVGNLDSRRQSVGFGFSNRQLVASQNNEVTSFAGEILQDWDVELYRNGILVGQLFDIDSGRYEFNNIPLLVGNNVFELVFYGPQGQVKRERIERLLDSRSLREQPFNYAVSFTKDDSVLLKDISTANNNAETYSFSGNYGFTSLGDTRVNIGHVNQIGPGAEHLYNISLSRLWFDRVVSNINYSASSDNRTTLEAQLRTNFAGQALSFRSSLLDGVDDKARLNVSVSAAGNIFNSKYGRLTHFTEVEKRENNREDAIIYRNNLGFNLLGANFYNQLEFVDFEETQSALFGSFGFQANLFNVFTRVFVNYSDNDDSAITNVGAEFSYSFTPSLSAQLGFNDSQIDDNSLARLNLNYQSDWWSIAATASSSKIVGDTFGLIGRLNFGGSPERGYYVGSNRNLTSNGSLVMRAFVDANGNYTYDEGEQLLEGLRFISKQSTAVATTGSDGKATLINLQAQRQTDIEIVKSTIDDPFLAPALDGISITPRQAFVDMIDFPLLNSGEIDGVVSFEQSDKSKTTATYLELGLYDSKGELVQTTTSEFDGYFLFTQVVPGRYQIQALSAEIERKGLQEIEQEDIVIEQNGTFIDALDLSIPQKDQQVYFIATLGEFTSSDLLHAFWSLNKSFIRSITATQSRAAVYTLSTNKLSLAIASSTNETHINNICSSFKQADIPCDIRTKQIWR